VKTGAENFNRPARKGEVGKVSFRDLEEEVEDERGRFSASAASDGRPALDLAQTLHQQLVGRGAVIAKSPDRFGEVGHPTSDEPLYAKLALLVRVDESRDGAPGMARISLDPNQLAVRARARLFPRNARCLPGVVVDRSVLAVWKWL